MTTSTLFRSLLQAGIQPQDAEELEKSYGTEPDFVDGLEQVATLLALKSAPGMLPPTGEPWKTIFTQMTADLGNNIDIDTAWRNAIAGLDQSVQFSVTAAVNVRQKQILDFEAQKGKKRVKTKDYLKGLKQLGYTFKLNECSDTIEINDIPITDAQAARIRSQMRDAGFHQSNEMEDAYFADAWMNRYHPVKNYLSSLNYDGKPHIQELTEYFTDTHSVFSVWFRKWLIGSVAKVFEGEQNPMLVMDGPQGIGKSEFVRWLCPLPRFYIEGAINVDDKDSDVRLINYWIWEVSEVGATTRRSDVEALKAFLTKRTVTVRKSYAKHDIRKPAMASFVGTVNNTSGILSDPTGSRRFLISHITRIDWSYTSLDKNQIWAEAVAAYLGHENWKLTQDESRKAAEINELYQVDDIVEGLVLKNFKIDPTNMTWWLPTTEIIGVLESPYSGGLKGNSKGNAMQLSSAMTHLGCQKMKRTNSNGQRVWGYCGIKDAKTP